MVLTREDYKRAAEHGVSAGLLYKRFVRLGWELERAITQKPKEVAPRDPELIKWREQAKANGINHVAFRHRIRAKWAPEKAATTPVRSWVRAY